VWRRQIGLKLSENSCRIRGVPGIFLDVVGAKVAVDWTDVCLFDQ